MLGHIEQGLWTSSFVRMVDPRVVRYDGGIVRMERMPDVAEHDFTLVLIADQVERVSRSLIMLANVRYPRMRVVVVFKNRIDKDMHHTLLYCMREVLPRYSLFVPKQPLDLTGMRQAGLQAVDSEYFGVLYAGDMVHPKFFDRVSAALLEQPVDMLSVRRACLNRHVWATIDTLPMDRVTIFKTDAVKQFGGFKPLGLHPYDAEWNVRYQLQSRAELPELLFYRSPRTDDDEAPKQFEEFERTTGNGDRLVSGHDPHARRPRDDAGTRWLDGRSFYEAQPEAPTDRHQGDVREP